jgi:predicted short-subunit dehydrogenase-like oxidoreductase (DUF2520 family)
LPGSSAAYEINKKLNPVFLAKEIKNMIVVGSGNVAWHMINAFSQKGINVLQILARNTVSGRSLSEEFKTPLIMDPMQLRSDADLYLLTVQDSQLKAAAESLKAGERLLVHTSGYSSLETLSGFSSGTGVCWPLQTLSKGKPVDYRQVPFFVEGNNSENAERLRNFAALVSEHVMITDSALRQKVHLSAVIASNLSNHLYAIAADILDREGIPFDVLAPLIMETANKAVSHTPEHGQTGPAARNDLHVIATHLKLLEKEPHYREIYRLISDNIFHRKRHHHEEL